MSEIEQGQAADAGQVTEQAQLESANLDGYSSFEFQGEKYTPDKLNEILNGYKKYSEAAKEQSSRQELDEHFAVDRLRLLKDPSLADQFRQKYPKEYHWILDFLPTNARQESAQGAQAQTSLPPEFADKLSKMEARLNFYDQRAHEAEVQNASAQIDKITGPLFEKFPMADDEAVFAKADVLLQSGQKLTEKTWERIIRENHEKAEKKYDRIRGSALKQQLDKGRRGADVGPGGGAPGQAPQRARTFDEAREQMLKAVMQS